METCEMPSAEQMHILLHSLGLTYKDEPYRNHYAAEPDDPELREMVRLGWMRLGLRWPGSWQMYHVTDEGRALALAHHRAARPQLNRQQRAYRSFLRADTGGSFGEYLGIDLPRLEERRVLGGMREYRYTSSRATGGWCWTKRAAKRSYKEWLRKRRQGAGEKADGTSADQGAADASA